MTPAAWKVKPIGLTLEHSGTYIKIHADQVISLPAITYLISHCLASRNLDGSEARCPVVSNAIATLIPQTSICCGSEVSEPAMFSRLWDAEKVTQLRSSQQMPISGRQLL
jgi:hypothetical protein